MNTEPIPGRHDEIRDEVATDELAQRVENVRTLLDTLDNESRDRLLNYDDGQTILSVLLGVKPAFILGLRPYRRPLHLIKAVMANIPGQFELSSNFFYDPAQVRRVIADNPDLFPRFEASRQNDTAYLSRYIDSGTPHNSYGLAFADALLSVFGLSSATNRDHYRNGLILGFPREAVDSSTKPGPRKVYRRFGYEFTYQEPEQGVVDRLNERLRSSYEYAESKVPILKSRLPNPKIFY